MTRVLIVDDEPDILFLAKMMLEGDGHDVTLAKSSKECFEKLKEKRPDLILLDIMMPGGDDGWKTCREIKESEKTQDIPLAMFTVRSSDDSVEKSYSCGADAHIKKPFYKKELLETVENLVKTSGS
jgi:CheY-like chemotaxis protein